MTEKCKTIKRPRVTKRHRMLWVIEKWSAAHDHRPFTTSEVAEWAIAEGLLEEQKICIHCGCTDLEGCSPVCWWVDYDEIVCSACLLDRSDQYVAGDVVDVECAFDALAIDHASVACASYQQPLVLKTILLAFPEVVRVRGWCQNCRSVGPVMLVDHQWCEKCAPACRKAATRSRRSKLARTPNP